MSDKRLAFPPGPCECELQEVNVVERKKIGESEMWCWQISLCAFWLEKKEC